MMNLIASRTSIIVAAALFAAATFMNASFDGHTAESRTTPTTLMLTSPQQTTAALVVGNAQ
jgi:hypothetical protein